MKTKSLIYAYLLDGRGGAEKLSWEQIKLWKPQDGVLWIHLNYTSSKAKQWLKKDSGLDKISIIHLISEETRPRAVLEKNGLLLSLRGVNLNPNQETEDMVSIRLWLDKSKVITSHRRNLLSIDEIKNELDAKKGPKSSSEFVKQLNDKVLNKIGDLVDGIEEKVDDLEEELLTGNIHLIRPEISNTRRKTIILRRYLAPQREALYRLFIEQCEFINNTDKLHLRESTDRIIRYIEDLDAARDRATIAQEELSSRLSEQLNARMYILSLVAIIFLPLTFITGLLGINVGGIPGANNSLAFSIVSLSLVVLLGISIWLLKKQKWL